MAGVSVLFPRNDRRSLAHWIPLLFVLIVATLIGSVLLPAGESARVLDLLDDSDRLIEPARLATSQLESGTAEESAELQRYVVAGDTQALSRFRQATADDERHLATLRRLSGELGGGAADEARALDGLVQRWRTMAASEITAPRSIATFIATADDREAVRDSVVEAAARVQAELADEASRRRAALAIHEREGLFINAMLVIIALVTISAGFELVRRERQRARREGALRIAAEALAGVFTLDEVTSQLERGAVELLGIADVRAARIERSGEDRRIVTISTASSHTPTWVIDGPYGGSLVERAIEAGEPMLVEAGEPAPSRLDWLLRRRPRLMVIPLGVPAQPIGAVVARESDGRRFKHGDLGWAGIFGHIVSLAYEKVRLLQEAREGNARLERAMDSRGRLMRGFSHDVKNPLGAAEGYAALLEDGIYGSLGDEQRSTVGRVRTAIQRALTLIDDLHELARAETGNLLVRIGPGDLASLLAMVAEEYRGAAAAKQLRLTLEVEPGLPVVQTDVSRVRQIIGNLLSNAIKYTQEGSIVLRARSDSGAPPGTEPCVHVEVVDTGPGIPAGQQVFIFDEFRRLGSGDQSGAGLGLAISRAIADALGCRIHVESEVGKGSRFGLRIPLVPPPALRETVEPAAAVVVAPRPAGPLNRV